MDATVSQPNQMIYPSSDQAFKFLSQFVTVTRTREIATPGWSYFVPTSSSVEYEEEGGQWMHAQQFQHFAVSMGCPLSRA